MPRVPRRSALLAALLVVFSAATIDVADARRGGGFGSRGARTYDAPPVTRTAPNDAAPINRSVTQPGASQTGPASTAAGAAAATSRGGLFNGRGLLGGLMLGGLFGVLMGAGFGGLGGMLALLFQVLLIGLAVWLVMRLLRGRRQQPARPAYAGAGAVTGPRPSPLRREAMTGGPAVPPIGSGAARGPAARRAPSDAVGITPADYESFERSLQEVQAAFGAEDYAALRRLATPEVMSHLAEELSVNATKGVRNVVEDVRLLQGDLAEAWREGARDYATVAMRYASVDYLVDRETGAPVSGADTRPSETTEIWTFVRPRGGTWQLSAIQDVR